MSGTFDSLALQGGTPVRTSPLPYGHQEIDDDDIAAVSDALRSDWLTTGPRVGEFEAAFAAFVGTKEAVAVSSGTAALHAALHALEIGPGDEVIVTPLTFAASANAIVYQGGTPVFADVCPDTLLLDPDAVEAKITPRTRAIVAVDYAGQPCDYGALRQVAERNRLHILDDACHGLGGHDEQGTRVGALADLSTFSLHPVKPITTGEGGMITTNNEGWARRMRVFRNHGITTDHRQRQQLGSWFYEMVELGYNYRLTDFQSALGLSQLRKLPRWTARRQEIARRYDAAFHEMPAVQPLTTRPGVSHAYHLYVIRLLSSRLTAGRETLFSALRAEGIGVNVHYIPVYFHPYYREKFGMTAGLCPQAEAAYEEIISLPIFPGMTDADADDVVEAVAKITRHFLKES